MRSIRPLVILLLCAGCPWVLAADVSAPTALQGKVSVRAIELPGGAWSMSPAPLRAFLFEPQVPSTHRGAVVMLHGCGGAYAKDGNLNLRHQMWGNYLASLGYLALMLDSFTPRGIAQICTTRLSDRTLKMADRVGDAYAALAFLRGLPNVDGDRIALLGWSHGGGVVLDAINTPPSAVSGFKAAVSLYPGCTWRNTHANQFKPYAPVLLLIGEADDWTPAAPCKALTESVLARGGTMQIVTYPDTYHDFDNPALTRQRVRTDVPNGVNPGQGVTTAPNPVATEDAKHRVAAFLSTQLP